MWKVLLEQNDTQHLPKKAEKWNSFYMYNEAFNGVFNLNNTPNRGKIGTVNDSDNINIV